MREALRIDKKVYGDEHPDVAKDLNNIAQLLKAQVGLQPTSVACVHDGLICPRANWRK